MATSSKRRRTSPTKQNSADKARVISIGRSETLPRKSTPAAGRSKEAVQVQPPFDAPTESPGPAAARPKRKTSRPQKSESVAALKKTIRAGRSTSRKPKVEPEFEVDASAIVDEATIVELPPAPPIEAILPSTEIAPPAVSEETRVPAMAGASTDGTAVAESAPRQGKRALTGTISRLLSLLSRWTGVRP